MITPTPTTAQCPAQAHKESFKSTPPPAQPTAVHTQSSDGNDTMRDWEDDHGTSSTSKGTKRKRGLAIEASAPMNNISNEPTFADYSAVPRPKKRVKKNAFVECVDDGDNLLTDSNLEDDANAFGGYEGPGEVKRSSRKAKKSRAQKKVAEAVIPEHLIQQFLDGVAALPDSAWTSPTVNADYCQVFKWFDKDNLSKEECAKRWSRMGHGKEDDNVKNRIAIMYKHRTVYGPQFYKEKGLPFVPLTQKNAYLAKMAKVADGGVKQKKKKVPRPKKAAAPTKSAGSDAKKPPAEAWTREQFDAAHRKPGSGRKDELLASRPELREEASMEEPYVPTLDGELDKLFVLKFDSDATGASCGKKALESSFIHDFAADKGASKEDIARYHSNRRSQDLLYFKCKRADCPLDDPGRLVLDRQTAAQYAGYLQEQLNHEPGLQLIGIPDAVRPETVLRFVACISPTLRSGLPTHDLVEVQEDSKRSLLQTRIGWSMMELQELYLFSLQMKCSDILDMILDRLHEEFHRPEPRILIDHVQATGRTEFNILDISPEFLNTLAVDDPNGLDLFTSLLVLKKQEGWAVIQRCGLNNWSDDIKHVLKQKLENGISDALNTKEEDKLCKRFHHHSQEDGRNACYKVQTLAVPTNPVAQTSASSVVATKQKPVRAKLDVEAYRGAIWGRKDDAKQGQHDARNTGRAEQDGAAGYGHAERNGKRKIELEHSADHEGPMKKITLDPLPNLAYPITYQETNYTREKPKERYQFYLYPPELGNGPNNDKETAIEKQALVMAKLEEFAKHRKCKDLDELEDILNLPKGFGLAKAGKGVEGKQQIVATDVEEDSGDEGEDEMDADGA